MKKYPEYIEIQNSWVDCIPSHWRYLKLKHFVTLHGRIGWKGLTTDDYVDDGIILLGVRNITTDYNLDTSVISRIPIEKYDESPEIQLQKDDVLLAKTGATIGKCCVVHEVPEPMTVNAAVNIFRMRSGNHSKYFMYFIASDLIQKQFFINISSNAQGNLFQRDIREIHGYLPKYEEQSKIATFLDQKTRQIDDLIAKQQKLIELLKEERTALVNHAVTKGLDSTVPRKETEIEWLGKIPEHWELRKIGRSFKIIGSGTTPTSGREEFYENGNIPWVLTGDLNDNYLSQTSKSLTEKAFEEHSALKKFPAGSLVIAMYGATIGKLSILKIDATTNQACCVLADSSFFSIKFLFYWFLSNRSNIISLSYGGGQPNISQEIIRNIKVPCPSIEEQSDIVKFIDHKCNAIDTSLLHIEKEIELISEYKTSLINEAVTGKIDVRDYQINHA
jgi:type I restriction enzyme, S subunit